MSFNIKLKDQKFRETPLLVNPNDKIGDLKSKVGAHKDDVWKFDGDTLKNDKTLDFYGIEKDDVINTNPKHPGGVDI